MAKNQKGKYAGNIKTIQEGRDIASKHPLIKHLPNFGLVMDKAALNLGTDEWLRITVKHREYRHYNTIREYHEVTVCPNIRRRAAGEQWAYVFSRVQLHIVLNHLNPEKQDLNWHLACWFYAEQMISNMGIGQRPPSFPTLPSYIPRGDENALAHFIAELPELPLDLTKLSLSIAAQPFWEFEGACHLTPKIIEERGAQFAKGIREAVTQAIDEASGISHNAIKKDTKARRARDWMMSEYPLLAALAASFTLIEDIEICQRMKIEVAAISDETQEIYLNPHISLTEHETRFVIAHEFLHSGLRHIPRRQGRDPWFWNVACDFVVNDWLIEMQVGTPPEDIGYLYDPDLKGKSAEEIYDEIVSNLRWQRKLKKARTMNGSQSDMIEGDRSPAWWQGGGGMDLDHFYRRALSEGLELHLGQNRGLLPAGLVEEIRTLLQPPIPWDVELGQWLDQFFPPLEKRRSYARAHRRQSATPNIPRPAWIAPDEERKSRVFGAVLDSSGSMDRADLGKAIGAIASYAMSRDVGFVRLIQCDARPHDSGYVAPESLLNSVKIFGRGGTVLMPGITMLEAAKDFPKDAPILVLTDGYCDTLKIEREHAYLLTSGGRLPFRPQGPVFQFS